MHRTGRCTADVEMTGNVAVMAMGYHTFSYTVTTGGDNAAIGLVI